MVFVEDMCIVKLTHILTIETSWYNELQPAAALYYAVGRNCKYYHHYHHYYLVYNDYGK